MRNRGPMGYVWSWDTTSAKGYYQLSTYCMFSLKQMDNNMFCVMEMYLKVSIKILKVNNSLVPFIFSHNYTLFHIINTNCQFSV